MLIGYASTNAVLYGVPRISLKACRVTRRPTIYDASNNRIRLVTNVIKVECATEKPTSPN